MVMCMSIGILLDSGMLDLEAEYHAPRDGISLTAPVAKRNLKEEEIECLLDVPANHGCPVQGVHRAD